MLFKVISCLELWASGSPIVQWSRTICAIFVKGVMRLINNFEFGPVVQMSFIRFFYLEP